jgi:hypothetical protein
LTNGSKPGYFAAESIEPVRQARKLDKLNETPNPDAREHP